MYKHILIPTDGSPLSDSALKQGLVFAKSIGARVTILTVAEPFHIFTVDAEALADTSEEYEVRIHAQATKLLESAAEKAKTLAVDCKTLFEKADEPYEAIINAANENGCDLIAMASHGRRGISALVIGSVTMKVLTHSKIPVLVYR